jgi:hypothetical protein
MLLDILSNGKRKKLSLAERRTKIEKVNIFATKNKPLPAGALKNGSLAVCFFCKWIMCHLCGAAQ